MHTMIKLMLLAATLSLTAGGGPRLGSRALILFKNLPGQKPLPQHAPGPVRVYPPHLLPPMYPTGPLFHRGPMFPPPPPYMHHMPPFMPFGPGLPPLHVYPLHAPGPFHSPMQIPIPSAPVQPMVTPVHIHTFGGGNVGTNLASSLTGGSGGGTSVSAGPTYLIQELRHHNTPAATKSHNSGHSGGGGSSGHSSEKLLLLKDFKDLKAYGAGTPILKTKKVISQNTQSDSLKGLGGEILPPIVLNANTLAQLGLGPGGAGGLGGLGGFGGLGGLSGSLTGGLGPGGIQDTLLFKGGNAIW